MLSKRKFLKAVVGLSTLVGTYSSLAKEATQFPMKRTAIVYYSHSGNTQPLLFTIAIVGTLELWLLVSLL